MRYRLVLPILSLVGLLVVAGAVSPVFAEENAEVQETIKQCEKGDTRGCVNLGLMYDYGSGVKQDYFEAVKLYRRACEKGEARGCSHLGAMYEFGWGVRQSNDEALTYYGKACDLKNQGGCDGYARLKTVNGK